MQDHTAVSTAFHVQDRKGSALITDEADGLALDHEILDGHFKTCEAPKYSVIFAVPPAR